MESSHQQYEDLCPRVGSEDTCPERLSNLSRATPWAGCSRLLLQTTLCSVPWEAGCLSLSQGGSSKGGREGGRGCSIYDSTLFTWGLSLAEVIRPPFLSCALLPKATALTESQAWTKFLQAWRWEQCGQSPTTAHLRRLLHRMVL